MKVPVKLLMASVLALIPNSALAEQTLLLNLKYKSDNTVTKEIRVYGNDIDPNSSSTDEQFSLSIDGQTIKIPSSIYARLEWLRRSFSYDSLSGGIQRKTVSPKCLLGGPARGIVLEARYLTYQTPSYKIVSSQMRSVFSLPSNCLFAESYSPKNSSAREDARGVVEILNTLNLFLDQKQE